MSRARRFNLRRVLSPSQIDFTPSGTSVVQRTVGYQGLLLIYPIDIHKAVFQLIALTRFLQKAHVAL